MDGDFARKLGETGVDLGAMEIQGAAKLTSIAYVEHHVQVAAPRHGRSSSSAELAR